MSRSTCEKVASNIAGLLERADDVTADQVEEVSTAYFLAVETVNARLQDACNMLRKGQRDEAIEECERDPNLLDTVELLDIEDLAVWQELHRRHNLVLPPLVQIKKAATLNRAYAEQAPMKELLKKYRLLALGHAPLKHRLLILRQIADRDPNGDIWDRDVAGFESSRIAEIRTELPRLQISKNVQLIEELYAEVAASQWQTSVPSELMSSVVHLRDEAVKKAARERLKGLESTILHAYEERDAVAAQRLRESWGTDFTVAELGTTDPLLASVKPAFDWLDELDRKAVSDQQFQELQAKLEGLLDDPNSKSYELETAYVRLQQFECEIPDVLGQRYLARIRDCVVRADRTRKLKLLAVLGIMAIVAVPIFAVMQNARFERRVANAVKTLSGYRAEETWDEGAAYASKMEQSEARVFASTSFQDELMQFHDAKRKDGEEEKRFKIALELFKELSSDVEEKINLAETSSDEADLVQAADLALRKMQSQLSILQREPEKATSYENALTALEQRLTNVKVANVNRRLRSAIPEVERLRRESEVDEFDETKLRSLEDQINRVFLDYRLPANHPALAKKSGLLSSIQQIWSDYKQFQRFQSAQRKVTNAVGNVEQFRTALQQLADDFPENPWASQWRQMANPDAPWGDAARWSVFADNYLSALRRLSPERAQHGLDAQNDLKEPPTLMWQGRDVLRWGEKLDVVAALSRRPRDLIKEFSEYDAWWMGLDHIYYEYKEGQHVKHYGVRVAGKEMSANVSLLDETDRRNVQGGSMGKPPVIDSPQSRIVEPITDKLETIEQYSDSNAASWESNFFDIVSTLSAEKEPKQELDPILQLQLLEHVIRVSADGSHAITRTFSGAVDVIRDQNETIHEIVTNGNWLLDDGIVKESRNDDLADLTDEVEDVKRIRLTSRRILTNLLENIPAEAAFYKAVNEAYSLPPRVHWIGWLNRDRSGAIQLLEQRPSTDDFPTGGVLVVMEGSSFTPIRMVGQTEFMAAAKQTSPGQPVFLVQQR